MLRGFVLRQLRWYLGDGALGDFCESGSAQRPEGDGIVERTLFEIIHHLVVVVRQERDRRPLFPSTPSSSDTVDVGLDCVRHLVVDDQTNVCHIDTTAGEIGGHQDVCISGTECLQGRLSLLLILARVQRGRVPL